MLCRRRLRNISRHGPRSLRTPGRPCIRPLTVVRECVCDIFEGLEGACLSGVIYLLNADFPGMSWNNHSDLTPCPVGFTKETIICVTVQLLAQSRAPLTLATVPMIKIRQRHEGIVNDPLQRAVYVATVVQLPAGEHLLLQLLEDWQERAMSMRVWCLHDRRHRVDTTERN